MSKEIEDEKTVKQCPQGHFYNSELDECPYCNGLKIDDDLEKLLSKTDEKRKFPDDIMAMCYILPPGDL